MSNVTISTAIKARLRSDQELVGLLLALRPEGAPAEGGDIDQLFMEQVGPGESALPLVLWSGDDGQATGGRCGGFGERRTRYRVEVVAPGDDLGALEPLRERIETLLAGWDTGEASLVLDGNWGRRETGVIGTLSRLGNYYIVIE